MNSEKPTKKRDVRLQQLFDALGDKTRFTMVQMLQSCDNCVSEIAERLNITPAGASQQIKILESVGILVKTRNGQRTCYDVNTDDPDVKSIINLMSK